MVFSERDIDLLRLLCWCQYLPPEAACQICPEAEVQLLRSMGLVRQHRTSGALLLTTQGAEWLGGICPGGVPAFSRSYHKSAIQRRLRISRLALTAYRAGVHIFTTSTEELSASPALFFSSITRSRGSNPWGSTRVAALAHLGELLCSIHYVCPGNRQDSAHRRADGVQQSDGRLPGAPPGDGLCRGELCLCPLRAGGGISARGYQAHSLWRGVPQTAPSRSPALLRRHRRHPAPDPGDARLPPAAYPGRAEITIRPAAGGRTRPGRHVSGAPLRHGGGYGSAAH